MQAKPINAYQCGNCGKAYLHYSAAEDCCIRPPCALPGCDQPRDGRSSYCGWPHQSQHHDQLHYERVLRAEPAEWDPDTMLSDGDNWWSSPDDYWEYLREIDWQVPFTPNVVPEWAFATYAVRPSLDLVGHVGDQLDNFTHDADDDGDVEFELDDHSRTQLQQVSDDINQRWRSSNRCLFQRDTRYRIPLRELMLPYFEQQQDEED